MAFIDQAEILNKSNGGLDIILQLYPDVEQIISRKTDKFKLRPEKTASASLKKLDDGTYVVTDWGADQKPMNAISLFMYKENVSFRQALELLGERLSIAGQTNALNLKPGYEKKAPEPNQELGSFHYTTKEASPDELAIIGPHVTQELLTRYNLWPVSEYRYIRADKDSKQPVAHCFSSTEHYPIFIFEMGDWRKRLEPLNPDKAGRFRYDGDRPKDYIFGLTQCQKAWEELNKGRESADEPERKLDEIILCSGDRDALNVASMGYHVIWMNSESAKLSEQQFNKLKTMAHKVFNVPDLDATGQKQGHALALQHLDIHTLRLPKELLQRKDWRGNPCKDLRDFMKYYKKWDFKQLLETALPYRMYDARWRDVKDGPGFMEYRLNHAQIYNFLQQSGYHRLSMPNSKTGYIYIKIDGNIVKEVSPVEVKSFIFEFLKKRNSPPTLLNSFYRSQNQLSEASFSNMEPIEIDFTDCDKKSQFLFFQNAIWEVTKDAVTEHLPGSVEKYVWDEEIIKHPAKITEPPFAITYNSDTERYDIAVKDDSCLFFQYLRNASRVHWRKEQEQGETLTADEKYEETLHLVNKIYSLGYLLHRYKDPSKPWCVFATDNKISETGESHGGSGKSIAYKAPRHFMKYVTLEGRNAKLTENPHVFELVTPHVDYLLVDDANQYIKFDFFFSAITGEMIVNPKHGKQYELSFEEVPKFCITSNYTLRNIDPSTERRLLYTVFSDYYHYNKDGEYKESRSPYDDFNKNLFTDFTPDEWNKFFNTMAACLQTYLNFPKIDPPMDNVDKRNLRTIMTELFKEWADVYFDEFSHRTDRLFVKRDAFQDFVETTKQRSWNAQRFKKSLSAWCKYYNYTLNPEVLVNNKSRIIGKHQGLAVEFIYIKAFKEKINTDGFEAHDGEAPEEDPFNGNNKDPYA
jgi:hypothetical protein